MANQKKTPDDDSDDSDDDHTPTVPRPPGAAAPAIKSSNTPIGGRSKHSKGLKKKRASNASINKRNVTFNPKLKVTLIISLAEFSKEEALATWYQATDYADMEEECDFTSEFLEYKQALKPGFCGRGLECWTSQGEHSKERNVSLAMDLVWNAQIEYWKDASSTNSQDDPWALIAYEYQQVSIPCMMQAHGMALKDETEIKSYLASAKSIEKARRKRVTGSRHESKVESRILRRSHSDKFDKVEQAAAAPTAGRAIKFSKGSIRRSKSELPSAMSPQTPSGGKKKVSASAHTSPKTPSASNKSAIPDASAAAKPKSVTAAPQAARKIVFKSRSKQKVPLSPVKSLCSVISEGESYRRSSASVGSDGSSKVSRRMLRTPKM
jgi:hypothetical protein